MVLDAMHMFKSICMLVDIQFEYAEKDGDGLVPWMMVVVMHGDDIYVVYKQPFPKGQLCPWKNNIDTT